MKTHRWEDLKKERKVTPERRVAIARKVSQELAAISLREIREASGKTQAEVAVEMDKVQAEISQLEQRDDVKLSTLRRYVRALGGTLEVVAIVGGKRVCVLDG